MNSRYSVSTSDSSSRSGGAREHEPPSPRLASSPELPVLAHLLPQHRRFTVPEFVRRDDPWWRRLLPGYSRPLHQNPSGMYTIISMSDERLQPRRTWLWISLSGLLVSILIAFVFVLVPRGVTIGSITFVPHNWHKRSDHGTYTLQLGVHIPVYNANYYPAQVYGTMKVLFLDVQAGSDELPGLPVEARSQSSGQMLVVGTCVRGGAGEQLHLCLHSFRVEQLGVAVQELHFCMDASGVPVEYGLTIIQMCMLYPRKLMFICKADLTVKTWVAEYELPTIDTYFMVNCYDQEGVDATAQVPLDPICSSVAPSELAEQQEGLLQADAAIHQLAAAGRRQ